MNETRTEKISVNLTPSVKARLDAYRKAHHWPRSTAVAVLIELGLDISDKQAELESKALTRPDLAALLKEYDVDQGDDQ